MTRKIAGTKQEKLIYYVDGPSLVANLKVVNDALLRCDEINNLVVGDVYKRVVEDGDGEQIMCAFTPLLHPDVEGSIIEIACCDLLVAPNDRREGLYCVNQFNEAFHVTNGNIQIDTFIRIYTECVNCLIISIASTKFEFSESEQ